MIKIHITKNLKGLDVMEHVIPGRIDNSSKGLAEDMAQIMHESWSPDAPSAPGSPPAVVTGNLDKSIQVERQGRDLEGKFVSGKNAAKWAVIVGEKYGATLEHGGGNILPRPFVLPAAMAVSENMADAYREAFNIRW
jgi:hypothetical protein